MHDMKKLILVVALVLFGYAASAQSTTPQIDTTDATTKYLLQRIEQLEHKVNFEQDRNSLSELSNNLQFMWNDIQLRRVNRYNVREYVKAADEQYNSLITLTTLHAIAYNYDDAELGVIKSTFKKISLYIDGIKDWLKN